MVSWNTAAAQQAAAAPAPAPAPAWKRPTPAVLPGIDVLLTEQIDLIKGKKIGLITNPSGITADGRQNIDALVANPDVKLVALFGPEHGVRGEYYGGEKITSGKDPETGIAVYSLYGATQRPKPEWIKDLDMLLYDIQDTGNRSYTFIGTMAYAMEECKKVGVPFMVLDRPNPMNGNLVDGNILDPAKAKSLVGLYPIAYFYGMTPGESAEYFNKEFGIGCDLRVVKMKGWKRAMNFADTGLMWVPPSQHVPRYESSYHMGVTGTLGELHTVNEGVGYTLPFETLAAPWINGAELAKALNARNVPGVFFRPISYTPRYGTHSGKKCQGVQIHILDYEILRPIALSIHLMEVLQKMYPENHPLGNPEDKANAGRIGMFTKVMGTDLVRNDILAGKSAQAIIDSWKPEVDKFMATRAKYLLYD
jgi:uncharacterized protein YbbC (DUF1343 family)